MRREVANNTERFKELRYHLGRAAYDALAYGRHLGRAASDAPPVYGRDLKLSEASLNATDGYQFLIIGSERGEVRSFSFLLLSDSTRSGTVGTEDRQSAPVPYSVPY